MRILTLHKQFYCWAHAHGQSVINDVITKGRYLSREALDKLLQEIAAKAVASPFKNIE